MTNAWASFRYAMWVGWEMESNWTKRWLFFLYSTVRPLSLSLIPYFIFKFITTNPAANKSFLSVFVGNAFFTIFIAVASGVSWVIIQDREHFRIIRYIYTAPMPFWVYILGRSTAVLLISLVSLAMTLLVARFALGLPVGPGNARFDLLIPATLLGIVSGSALGLIFGGLCLITARHSMLMAEGAGAIFLLLCGVVYPIDALPRWTQWAGMALPMTYWMELVRRSFGGIGFSPRLMGFSDGAILFWLTLLAIAFSIVSFGVFRTCENAAKRLGKLDETTNY